MRGLPLWARDGTVRGHALVDDGDFETLNQWRWSLLNTGRGYVVRGTETDGVQKMIYLHRQIMGEPDGLVDHKDLDTLNNQRHNLRVATRSQNGQNRAGAPSNSTTGVRGVCWYKKGRCWRAYSKLNQKQFHLGYFDTIDEAEAVVLKWRANNMPFSSEAAQLRETVNAGV